MEKRNGKIQIYTGDGKGKTTASLGLSLRAIGAGKKVAIVQFMKKPNYSEHKAIKKYKLPIKVFTFGIGFYKIMGDKHAPEEHYQANLRALKKAKKIIDSKKYDLIILDEILNAINRDLGEFTQGIINPGFELLDENLVIDELGLDKNDFDIDIVLTGRSLPPKLKKIADLVTEMKPIKHYFDKGLQARQGIEY